MQHNIHSTYIYYTKAYTYIDIISSILRESYNYIVAHLTIYMFKMSPIISLIAIDHQIYVPR